GSGQAMATVRRTSDDNVWQAKKVVEKRGVGFPGPRRPGITILLHASPASGDSTAPRHRGDTHRGLGIN
ncbi:MAG: hypothetical protein MUF23_03765, partial [Pirellula sp.]|nr:hypothetical protein [Pirellula sp.]